MERASGSRRRAPEPALDCIEDAPSQQDQEEGVDEDEDEQPRKRTRRATDTRRMVNKGKGKARVKGENVEQNDDEEEDGGEDGRDKIDVANFCDQSLTKADATRLTGLSQDWERMRETLHASAYQTLNDIARVVAEVTEDEKPTEELDEIIREIIDMEQEININQQIISGMAQKVGLEEPINDALERYEKSVKVRVNDYRKKTTRQKYAKNEEYKRFKEVQFEVHHPNTPMPPVTTMIEREPGDVTDDDDELEVGGATQDYRCPITMTILTDPLTSPVCGHSFSGAAIREFLGSSNKRCPATGCNKSFGLNDLRKNKDLERRAKAAARRLQAMESSDNSDAEVIE